MLKKLSLIISLIFVLLLFGCGSSTNEIEQEQQEETMEVNDSSEEVSKEESSTENSVTEGKGDLTLQILKVDEEAGVSIDDHELYQALQAEIAADPKMGDENDFSLLPYNVVQYEDGSKGIVFLAINRLNEPIRNLTFELTFGHQDGEYIFEDYVVDLPEDYMGVLEADGAVPFFLDISDEDEALFERLTPENVYIEMSNFGIDFAE